MNLLKKFVRDEAGMETVEWAIMAALIVAGTIITVTAIGGNGGGHAAGDLGAAQAELLSLASDAAACIARLESLGVLVKDADLGLLDFPALREGEPVLLCWHLGEDEVAFWHSYEEGYAGRKPIDWGELGC